MSERSARDITLNNVIKSCVRCAALFHWVVRRRLVGEWEETRIRLTIVCV
jgi:hypothetical protein